jgi:tetratricopeptide (TPR) repeat protein
MNAFCLLEPDSPEYLFGAKSLASFHGYRDIDRPGEPLHTFRPPGISLLMTPLAWVAPLAVVPAKAVVLAAMLATLGLAFVLAARGAPPGAALLAILAIASSPYALLHATEVATECPYLAVSFAAIALVTRAGRAPTARDVALLAALLAFLPFLRTIGVALIGAVALWCLVDRSRRVWLPAPAFAATATFLWMVRNHLAGGPTYFGAIAAELRHSSGAAFAAKAFDTAGFYALRFVDVLLPGVWPGRPLYERMVIGGTSDLGGLYGAGWIVAAFAIATAAWGAWMRRKTDGSLIALYVGLFVVVLAIYPPRHERLTWPLVPFVWILAPSGLAAVIRAASLKARGRIAAAIAAGTILTMLTIWQATSSFAMIRDNLAYASGGDAFYADRVPPLYFADWQAAGSWLRANAPAGSRVLTRHSDAGFTSGLPQESTRFEELPPNAWRARIASFGARYLVVPTSLYGKFFPLDRLGSDPAYTFEMGYQGRDVAVIRVSPNRSGTITVGASPSEAAIDACDTVAAREPRRTDLPIRCAELLSRAGKNDEAVARLHGVIARGGADVRVVVALAQMLFESGRNDEAARAFRQASELPEAELLRQTIERGLRSAEELAAAKSLDKYVRARSLTLRARDRMDALRWEDAYRLLSDAMAFAPDDPVVLAAAGDWMSRVGRFDMATGFYRQAGKLGDARSEAKGTALGAALQTAAEGDAASPQAIVAAAEFWAGDGVPGRALDILEHAAAVHPHDASIASHLADVRRFYGLD